MVIRNWRTQTMVSFGKSLIDTNHSYGQTMERIPELAGMRPRFIAAHDRLVTSYGDTIASNLAPLNQTMGVLDRRHDNWQRALYFALQSHIAKSHAEGDEARAADLVNLRDLLFPDGLKVVSYSYRGQAGQAEIIAARVTPAIAQQLADLPVHGSDAHAMLGQAHAAALELGQLEEQRSRIREAVRPDTPARARMAFITLLRLIRDLLVLSRDSDPGAAEILNRMTEIERAERARADGEPEDGGDGDDDGDGGEGDPEDGDDPAEDDSPNGLLGEAPDLSPDGDEELPADDVAAA